MLSTGKSNVSTHSRGLLAAVAGIVLVFGLAHAQGANQANGGSEELNPGRFGHSTEITNKWMPMKPGTRWVYEGATIEDDGKVVPHRIEITVTDLVKTIGGVHTAVSYDLDYTDNELVEAELAFYAQDNDGNVWLLGEYPEEYEDGKLTKAPAWLHGLQDAKAGIMMQADPRLGTPSYSEGWAPSVGWTDRGVVYQTGQKVTVPAGTFEDVLVVKESAQGEPDAEQLKYYAPGTGNVEVGWTGTKKTREVLKLIKVDHLTPKEMASVHAAALDLEKSAYNYSKDVYAHTTPLRSSETGPK